MDSFAIAATALRSQQLQVETIANNLANLNTNSYKKSRVTFDDLVYRAATASKDEELALRPGLGVNVSSISKVFNQGELKKTDNPLDVAIRGNGFIELAMPDGQVAYTRAGSLIINKDNLLASQEGFPIATQIVIPDGTTALSIEKDGRVLAQVAGESQPLEIGQIELTRFVNPSALAPIGNNLYAYRDAAGEAQTAKPGESELGYLERGYVEASNVKLNEELVSLVLAQRSYEVNARIIQASDEMQSIINNLRRF